MSDQEELIDSEGKLKSDDKKKTKGYYENRTIIYIVCMIGGGLIYSAFLSKSIFNILVDPLLYTISAIVIAIPIEAYRKFRRDKKNKKKGIEIDDDPLWFHIIESALSLLILILALSFLLVR